jgi:phosphoribosyl 1,2-cyclic phosphodiesterase
MRVGFWGTRGSIAAPGSATIRYGGNTACVSVRLEDGTVLILDAGRGSRRLGIALMRERPVTAPLFLSHCHWDHIQGFPFFAPAYAPETRLAIYGFPSAQRKIRDTMTDQMEGAYFPVDFHALSAHIEIIDDWDDPLRIGTARIRCVEANHPGGGVGFRIEEGDHSFVYLTDNELGAGDPERFIAFCRGAGMLVHDAQFTPEEMGAHRDWGHSSFAEVLDLARRAEVRRVALFHHDPERTDDEVDELVRRCHEQMRAGGDTFACFAAAEGMECEL